MTQDLQAIATKIAEELHINSTQVLSVMTLLDEGATVPFIARYRKEVTGGLTDTQLRLLHERLFYLRDLESRKISILQSIKEQDKLTESLENAILKADTKARLEDLYQPYRPKRRTKAQLAKEAGLEPLAWHLFNHSLTEEAVTPYINLDLNIANVEDAIEGAKQILIESIAEDAELINIIRKDLWQKGMVCAKCAKENPPHQNLPIIINIKKRYIKFLHIEHWLFFGVEEKVF